MPPGLYQYSIVVSTPQREMKFTAPTKERHEIWLNVSTVFFLTDSSLADYSHEGIEFPSRETDSGTSITHSDTGPRSPCDSSS